MEALFPVVDAQQLYRQWQDGKLLDLDERNALRPSLGPEPGKGLFADLLNAATERDS
jgi:hypothetical protein